MIPSIGILKPKLSSGEIGNGLLNDLVSAWEFDETSGTTVVDSHGTNDGTIYGATINQTGNIGKCYDFDGSNDRLVIPPDDFDFDPLTESYTVSVWLKSSDPSPTSSAPYIIVRWDNGYQHPYPFVFLTIPASNDDLRLSISNGYSHIFLYIDGASVWDNSWHMATLVVDHVAGEGYAYLDGVLEATGSITFTTYAKGNILATNDMSIGATTNLTRWYDGSMDQLLIYSRALSAADLSSLYNSGSGLAYSEFTT